MDGHSQISLEDQVLDMERHFACSTWARQYYAWQKQLRQYEQAPYWERIIQGGFFRKLYIKAMLDHALEEYLWETMDW